MKQPDIVFIFSDQHNPEYLGTWPGAIVRTPNLDRLAAEGVNLTNAYCPSPVCVPSRACTLTSTYPQDIGVFLNDNSMPSDWPTVAHSLGAAGYETVLSGRMHFIGADQRHGFEKRFVGDFTWQYPGGRAKNHSMRWDDGANMTYGPNHQSVTMSGPGASVALAYDDAVTQATVDFLEQREDDRPLFLTVGFYGPHNPFVGPKEYFDYYYDKVEVPEITDEYRRGLHPTTRTEMNILGLDDVTQEEVRRCTAAYCSMVQKMDDDIGTILKSVASALDPNNTIIIYSSDHGEMMGTKGLFYKFVMYEGSARVPVIMKWGSHFKPGHVIANLTNLVDIPPTLIEAAGAAQLPLTRGISLYRHLIDGTDVDPDRTTCSQIVWNKLQFKGRQFNTRDNTTSNAAETSFGADEPKDGLMAMIRWRNYKLIFHGLSNDQDYELYDLHADPAEDVNLAADPDYREIRDEMAAQLLEVWQPEAVLEKVLRDKAGFEIMQKWFEVYDRGLDEEVWIPDEGHLNYFDHSPIGKEG